MMNIIITTNLMTRQKIILLISGLVLLLIGFTLAVFPAQKKSGQLTMPNGKTGQTQAIKPEIAVVPAYVPEAPAVSPAAPIPAGGKAGPAAVSLQTAPSEMVEDQTTGRTMKVISIIVGEKVAPDRVYLNKGDNVRLDISNQQAADLVLTSTNKAKGGDIQVAPGEKKSLIYDTSQAGDFALICQTCAQPSPLVIRVLGGRSSKIN